MAESGDEQPVVVDAPLTDLAAAIEDRLHHALGRALDREVAGTVAANPQR